MTQPSDRKPDRLDRFILWHDPEAPGIKFLSPKYVREKLAATRNGSEDPEQSAEDPDEEDAS